MHTLYTERQVVEYLSKLGFVATAEHMRTMDREGGTLATQYTFRSVVDGLTKNLCKDQISMYWLTLNEVYIASKRAGLSQSVLTMFTEIDELDGTKEDHVTTNQFVE